MATTTHVTVRIKNELLPKLDAIAAADERSRGYVFNQALRFFLERNPKGLKRAGNKTG